MSVTHIQQAAEKRRSIYALNKQLPVPAAKEASLSLVG